MGVTSAMLGGMKIRRRTRMVNDVPMEMIYKGMSLERLDKLKAIHEQAYITVDDREWNKFGWGTGVTHLSGNEYLNMIEVEFRRLCDRAASKAGWHANKRNNRKKEAVK